MDVFLWQQAWDRYALAAQVTGQMPFELAMTHKAIVLKIAENGAGGRSRFVGVLYDEVARCGSCCLSRFLLCIHIPVSC